MQKLFLLKPIIEWPPEPRSSFNVYIPPSEKKDLILFPHRNAPEKQLNIFEDLQKELPQYNFINCQEHKLNKKEYHKLLGEAKMVFSANLQETLGISVYEGLVVGAIPLVPDRLSYSEMALPVCKYTE